MDLFEEIVRMRREGRRGALATIVHTNGSIPSYESSRMLVRDDGSIAGTIGGGCVEAEVWAAAKEVMRTKPPRKMTFNLNNEAAYDNGLICGGTLEIFVEPILPQPYSTFSAAGTFRIALAQAAHAAGFAIGVVDDRESFANAKRFPMADEIYTSYEDAFEKHPAQRIHLSRDRHARPSATTCACSTGPSARRARYIGMIGSKRKVLSVYQRARRRRRSAARGSSSDVHAPVGLTSARSLRKKSPSASPRS